MKSEEKSVLKLKTFEMNYRCCTLEPCLIQMDISGPTGWQEKKGGQLVGAECCKVNSPGTRSATVLVPGQRTGEMPAAVMAGMRTGL